MTEIRGTLRSVILGLKVIIQNDWDSVDLILLHHHAAQYKLPSSLKMKHNILKSMPVSTVITPDLSVNNSDSIVTGFVAIIQTSSLSFRSCVEYCWSAQCALNKWPRAQTQ